MSTSVLRAIGLVLNPVQCVLDIMFQMMCWSCHNYQVGKCAHLQARYKDLAAIVAGDFALLDQRDRGHKSLDGRGELAVGSILEVR